MLIRCPKCQTVQESDWGSAVDPVLIESVDPKGDSELLRRSRSTSSSNGDEFARAFGVARKVLRKYGAPLATVAVFLFWPISWYMFVFEETPRSSDRVEACQQQWVEANPQPDFMSWPRPSTSQLDSWSGGYSACDSLAESFWLWSSLITTGALILVPLLFLLLGGGSAGGEAWGGASRAGNGPTAVYQLFDHRGNLLYVGITNNVQRRMRQHSKSKEWWGQVNRREVHWCDSRQSAAYREAAVIKTRRPIHNVQHNRR